MRRSPNVDATVRHALLFHDHAEAGRAVVIRPRTGWSALRLAEVWRYRELLVFLTWRDIKVRYKQAVLGVAWAVLAPFVTMVVFTIVFGRLLGVKVGQYRRALRGVQLHGPAALGLVLRGCKARRQPCGELQPADQGLLSTAHHPDVGGLWRPSRLPHLVRRAGGPHGCSTSSRRGRSCGCPLSSRCPADVVLVRALALGAQRALPGRGLHHPLRDPALDVSVSGRLSDRQRAGEVEDRVR